MKDAIGGVFTLQAIVIALVIIMCLMAFAVNYSKAFRLKNEIRSIIEKHEGLTKEARVEINNTVRNYQYFLDEKYQEYCNDMGYDTYTGIDSEGGSGVRFCIKREYANNMGEINQAPDYRSAYYSLETFVNIAVPIVNNVIPFTSTLFSINGETALIYSNKHNQYGAFGIIENKK